MHYFLMLNVFIFSLSLAHTEVLLICNLWTRTEEQRYNHLPAHPAWFTVKKNVSSPVQHLGHLESKRCTLDSNMFSFLFVFLPGCHFLLVFTLLLTLAAICPIARVSSCKPGTFCWGRLFWHLARFVFSRRLYKQSESFSLCPSTQAWEGIGSIWWFFFYLVPVPGLMLFLLSCCIALSATAAVHSSLYLLKLNSWNLQFKIHLH